ncbi:hypothetical protein NMG60_11012023 [Bertholletia excelsa]
MDVISRNVSSPSSTLNPNAPMFVPVAYRAVEDFSDEWWTLVHSSPWFGDYWLQERFQEPQTDPLFPGNDDLILQDLDSLFDSTIFNRKEVKEVRPKDLVPLGALKWRDARVLPQPPRYAEKAPKMVNVRVSPRTIQQPR